MSKSLSKKPTLSAAFLKLALGHSDIVVRLLRDVAQAEGPEAIEAAGVSAQDCTLALSNALTDGHSVEAAELVGELNFGSLAQVQAGIQAYAELTAREPWNGWDPAVAHSYAWNDLRGSKDEMVALWIDSGALKIESEDFWEFVGAHAVRFESEKSAPGLSAYCARTEARCRPPRPNEISALGPIAMQSCVDGFGSTDSWSALRDLADGLLETIENLSAEDSSLASKRRRLQALAPERRRLQALALTLAEAAAPWARLPSHAHDHLGLAISLAEISVEAGVVFVRGAADVEVDLSRLNGRLDQPSAEEPNSYAVDWTPNGDYDYHKSRKILSEVPRILLPLSEIVAQWTSTRGRAVAQAAGFTSSPRAKQFFEDLVELSGLGSSPQRLALIERITLTLQSSTLPSNSAPTPRL